MNINLLVKVTSRAWSLSILALMHGGTPGRQSALLAASGAGRSAFGQSLMHLVELGLVERNPGHGHPLRPEYRLTPDGREVAKVAGKIDAAVPPAPGRDLLRRAWTIPVLAASRHPRHFSQIKAELSTITDRALSQSLTQLQSHLWIERRIDAEQRPPRPTYHAANDGLRIARVVRL